jgi:hypothetical protein
LPCDGVVGKSARDAERPVRALRLHPDNLGMKAENHVMFNLARFIARDYEFTLEGLVRGKHAFGNAEEAFTAEVFGSHHHTTTVAGLEQANRIRQSQARTPATIRRNTSQDFRLKHNDRPRNHKSHAPKLLFAVKFSVWDNVNLT